jgi:hypothetical protein
MCTYSYPRLLSLALITAVVACGGGDLTLPGDGLPSSLRAVSGDGQEGTVGSQLPEPLVVRLTDGAARPLSGVSLKFQFQSDVPAARINPAIVATDDTGFASVEVRLGNTAGEQTVEARLADDATGDLRTTFDLTAVKKKGKDGDGGGEGDGRGSGSHDREDD